MTNTNDTLTKLHEDMESDISESIERVKGLLKQSTLRLLEAAKEIARVKQHYPDTLVFERFLSEVGITKSQADKFVRIGNCPHFEKAEVQILLPRMRGWTSMYEVSKFDNNQLKRLFDALDEDPHIQLTRSVLVNIANDKPAKHSTVTLLQVQIDEDRLDKLTDAERSEIHEFLKQTQTDVMQTITVKLNQKVIKRIPEQNETRSSSPNAKLTNTAGDREVSPVVH